MKWEGQRESDNVDDVRDSSGSGGGGFGGMAGARGLSLGGVVVALILSWVLGVNPLTMLGLMQGGGQAPAPRAVPSTSGHAAQDPGLRFVKTVLASTEDVWTAYFAQRGQKYPPPRLEVFRGQYPTGCGTGDAAAGPFYCPADRKVYIDLSFYDVLRDRLGAPGEFAQAYVVAHEVGHHIQNLMGTSEKLDQARGRVSQAQYNALSVRLELQADCYAGIWASHVREQFDLGQADIDSALNAASQIGDDTLQRKARGTVVPESFTHGTSAQRVRWFKQGMQSGDLRDCDTFGATAL